MSFKYKGIIFSFLFGLVFATQASTPDRHFPHGTSHVTISPLPGVRTDLLKNIGPLIQKSIARGDYPGAVVLVSHQGHIIYRGVFGSRRILPNPAPMRFDTIFDLASLTKVVATTPAIMQLVEQGKLELDAPVKKYWPAFAEQGKNAVTIRQLLTHTSGLPADMDVSLQGTPEILKQITQLKLTHPPGTHYLYSDINFVVLAYLVVRMTHQPFDQYVENHIIKPLGMKNAGFLPPLGLRDRIAPTDREHHQLRWGVVQDPLAHAMGGVSGNAGLFASAADLGIYAQCLLDNGRIPAKKSQQKSGYLLGPLTVLKMTTPQTASPLDGMRGLGWDIDSAYSNRGVLFPLRSFGHTGWTGTSIWIDPVTRTYIIILTSRAHPKMIATNQIVEDRRMIANIVAASIVDTTVSNQDNTGEAELARAYPHASTLALKG